MPVIVAHAVWSGVAVLVLAWCLVMPVWAQPAVDLQLVLAVDASGSVDAERFELQKQGYVAAFRDPRVLHAIQAGPRQAIAVTLVQWTGPALQIQVLPWTVLRDAPTVQAFATALETSSRHLFGGGTSLSGIIDYAVPLLRDSPFQSLRRVLDISGDGSNNRGRPAAAARDEAVRAGIVINGLPILALEPGLERYFIEQVIGGPGAFVIPAESYETFAAAILKKLIREMATPAPALHPCCTARTLAPAPPVGLRQVASALTRWREDPPCPTGPAARTPGACRSR